MRFDLRYVVNGFHSVRLGMFESVREAVLALKEHVRASSGVRHPRYRKSWQDNHIRIDYGSADCYYLICLEEDSEN